MSCSNLYSNVSVWCPGSVIQILTMDWYCGVLSSHRYGTIKVKALLQGYTLKYVRHFGISQNDL